MLWEDPIVKEVRKVRDAFAKRFDYDLDAILRDLKEKERRSGRTVVSCSEKQVVAGSGDSQVRESF